MNTFEIMKLEHTVLDYLNNNDSGKFVDIAFIDEDYRQLKETVVNLKAKNLIVLEGLDLRNFIAFGIVERTVKSIKAKIKTEGKVHLHALNNGSKELLDTTKRKRKWQLSYFFNF